VAWRQRGERENIAAWHQWRLLKMSEKPAKSYGGHGWRRGNQRRMYREKLAETSVAMTAIEIVATENGGNGGKLMAKNRRHAAKGVWLSKWRHRKYQRRAKQPVGDSWRWRK
jgi:hypothetical protein